MYKWTIEEIIEHAWMECSCGHNPFTEKDVKDMFNMYKDVFIADVSELIGFMRNIYSLMEKADVLTVADNFSTYKIFQYGRLSEDLAEELEVKFYPDGKVGYAYGYVEKAFDKFLENSNHAIFVVRVK